MKYLRIYCFALLLAFTSMLQAQVFEISPFYGYRFGGEVENPVTGEDYGFEDAPAYGLILNIGPEDSDKKFEMIWSRQDSSVDMQGLFGVGKVDVTIDQIQIGSSVEMELENKRLRPYVTGLVGATYFDAEGHGSNTKFSLGVGGGAKYFIFPKVALRADLRCFLTVLDSSSGFIFSNGQTVVAFSGTGMWQGQVALGLYISF